MEVVLETLSSLGKVTVENSKSDDEVDDVEDDVEDDADDDIEGINSMYFLLTLTLIKTIIYCHRKNQFK